MELLILKNGDGNPDGVKSAKQSVHGRKVKAASGLAE